MEETLSIADKVAALIADLNENYPLPTVVESLKGTTWDLISVRVDEDGDLIRIDYLTHGPHGAPGIGIDIPAWVIGECDDEDDTWATQSIADRIEAELTDILRA